MINDEIREQREKLKGASFNEKLSYYGYYYWKHALVACIIVIAVITFGRDLYVNNLEKSLYIVFTDTAIPYAEDENIVSEFVDSVGIDTKKNPYLFDVGMQIGTEEALNTQEGIAGLQKVRFLFEEGDIDMLVSTKEVVDAVALSGSLAELDTLFSADLLEKYKDDFYYINQDNRKKLVGIYADAIPAIQKYYPEDATPILVIAKDAPHSENALAFFKFITKQK